MGKFIPLTEEDKLNMWAKMNKIESSLSDEEKLKVTIEMVGTYGFTEVMRMMHAPLVQKSNVKPKSGRISAFAILKNEIHKALNRTIGTPDKKCQDLMIIDPYFFVAHNTVQQGTEYLEEMINLIACWSGLKTVTIIWDKSKSRKKPNLVKEFRHLFRDHQAKAKLKLISSDRFHDRFWVVNKSAGLLCGSSLNHLGSRFCIIQQLSDDDLNAVLAEVKRAKNAVS